MDGATLTTQYSPSSAIGGDLMPFIQRYIDLSASAYAALPETQTLEYGPKPSNTYDIVTPKSDTPVALHVFIHGGYWQQLSKQDSFLPAPETLSHNMAFAALDYTLAPNATLDEIVDECVTALTHIFANAAKLNIDPTRIILSGSSAGAHLAAMCCIKLPATLRPRATVLLSGIYELEPLIQTYVNDPLQMDLATAQRNSPALLPLSGFPKTVIAWGGHETDEFKRQSGHFADLLTQSGTPVETLEMPHCNHFDILESIANTGPLGRKLVALADQT